MQQRHQFRADWHDYDEGVFFVTICTADKVHYLGDIDADGIRLSEIGMIAQKCLLEIPLHLRDVQLWDHVVMPNHIHSVLALVGTRHGASARVSPAASACVSPATSGIGCLKARRHDPPTTQQFHLNNRLAIAVGQFKSAVTRLAIKHNIQFAWQERFHEHIIRSRSALKYIHKYINENVENWQYDRFNSNHRDLNDAPWHR